MMRDPDSPDSGKGSNYCDESDVDYSMDMELSTPKKSHKPVVSRTLDLSYVRSIKARLKFRRQA